MLDSAVVLLSGGLDSATCLALARREVGDSGRVCALTFVYGQRHAWEVEAARRVAAAQGIAEHRVLTIDLGLFGGSALTAEIDVPKSAAAWSDSEEQAVPVTYVPARNTIFLAYALAYAETVAAARIYIGVNAVDYSGYPDCRPAYIAAFQRMADLATRAGVEGRGPRIVAPLLELSKAETIELGLKLGVDYSLTHTCYDPGKAGKACGLCDACRIRAAAFAELGLEDPCEVMDKGDEPQAEKA